MNEFNEPNEIKAILNLCYSCFCKKPGFSPGIPEYGNLSTVGSSRAGTDITLPLIDGDFSQPSSTIKEMLEETCSGSLLDSINLEVVPALRCVHQ